MMVNCIGEDFVLHCCNSPRNTRIPFRRFFTFSCPIYLEFSIYQFTDLVNDTGVHNESEFAVAKW